MNYIAIIGYPLKHTFSPIIYNSVFKAKGIELEYVAIEVKPQEFDITARRLLEDKRCKGFNVTIPYKEKIRALVDETTPAREIGAVNVVTSKTRRGDNTDWIGFIRSLPVGFSPGVATIIGAGGAAKAVAYALLKLGVKKLFVLNRTYPNAKRLKSRFSQIFPAVKIEVSHLSDSKNAISESEIIVNTTPVGMYPKEDERLPIDFKGFSKGKIAYDLVYNPPRTYFLKEAESQGARAINGLDMLLSQAYYNLYLWGLNSLAKNIFREGKDAVENAIRR